MSPALTMRDHALEKRGQKFQTQKLLQSNAPAAPWRDWTDLYHYNDIGLRLPFKSSTATKLIRVQQSQSQAQSEVNSSDRLLIFF